MSLYYVQRHITNDDFGRLEDEDVAHFNVLSQYFLAATDRNHDSQYGYTILESKFEAGLPWTQFTAKFYDRMRFSNLRKR
jgi:hypothetical protein